MNRQPKGIPVGGQWAVSEHPESGVTLYTEGGIFDPESGRCIECDGHYKHTSDCPTLAPTETPSPAPRPDAPKRLRHPARVREDPAFLEAMETVERESRVRNLAKGDWAREFGDDEYGIVKSVGVRTLTTDAWRDEDTDGGDHVVAYVPKETGDALLAEHGAIPARALSAYTKRRAAALDVADRFDATTTDGERRTIGHNELRKAARDVWRSALAAGLAAEPEWADLPSRHSTPEFQAMEQAFLDYHSLLTVAGHSDARAADLVIATREAIAAADRTFEPHPLG